MPALLTNSTAPFQTAAFGPYRWLVRSDADLTALAGLLADPERYFGLPGRQIKSSRVVTLAEVELESRGAPGQCVILRRLNYGKFAHRLRDWWRPARTYRAFRRSWELEQLGLPTPRALAATCLRRLTWPWRAYSVTEKVLEAENLRSILADASARPAALAALGRLLGTLHRHHLSHRDLKPGNILFQGPGRPCLIDLDAVRTRTIRTPAAAAREFRPFVSALLEVENPEGPALQGFVGGYCQTRSWIGREAELVRLAFSGGSGGG